MGCVVKLPNNRLIKAMQYWSKSVTTFMRRTVQIWPRNSYRLNTRLASPQADIAAGAQAYAAAAARMVAAHHKA